MSENTIQRKEKKPSSLPLRIISVIVVFVVLLFVVAELLAFATYMIPVMSSAIFSTMVVQTSASWVECMILWGFPTFFLVLVFGLFHFVAIRYIVLALLRWIKKVWHYTSEKKD